MKTKNRTRLHSGDRRELILKAARELFARTGLEGARTAELARAAGVSERLLYKHFPSKEALHQAALKSLADQTLGKRDRILALEPSTSTLVILTHFVIDLYLTRSPERDAYARAGLRSLAGDGEFVRFVEQKALAPLHEKLEQCIESAVAAGDIPKTAATAGARRLLIQAIPVGIKPWFLPDPPIVDFQMDEQSLVEEAVLFALRGLGMADEIIRRHYNAKAMALLAG